MCAQLIYFATNHNLSYNTTAVIKRQKNAVEQYKIQLEAMNEEMAMQDERDSEREAELEELEEQLDSIREQKTQMNNLLQENIEEMRILKGETEKDATNVMELEFNLQQKEATLDRVAKDVSEKAMKISELEESLEEKNRELDALKEELKESENSVQTMQQCLESASRDSFLFKDRTASGITDDDNEDEGGEGDEGVSSNDRASSMSIGASMASSQAAGGGTESLRRTSQVSQANSRRGSQRSWFNREASARSSFMGDDGEVSPETFEAELNAKDTTIATLNDTVTEHEETINTLRSEMVKMSSTYKQDSYLKRKEIAKLKQQNAEYALKLRALEKAFKCVNATEGMSVVGSNFHGHTSHGGGGSKHGGSLHGNNSRHSRSTHSVGEVSSKIDKAAAVKARLGGFPYEFPSASTVRRDSAVVQEANFFDDGISEQGSDLGMKGQSPEEN